MGWARANLLFDRFSGMPEAGSPMEILFLVIWRMRQQIDFQRTRTLVQSLLSQEGAESDTIKKAFEDLRAAFFPFEEAQKDIEVERLKKVMHREISRGAIQVTPMVDVTKTSQRVKLAKGHRALEERADMLRSGALTRLDQTPIDRAKSRTRRSSASWTRTGSVMTAAPPTTKRGKKGSRAPY